MKNRIKVLVVDDKRIIGDFFDFTLGYFGHSITVERNPNEVKKLVERQNYDIAFLDIMMPEKDGVQVLEEVKAIAPQMPVVMMSGYTLDEKVDEAMKKGAMGCLRKPFEMTEIRSMIQEALGRSIE